MAKDDKMRARQLAKAERERTRLPVDAAKLNMGNTYSTAPSFYEDMAFTCRDCNSPETWTAVQQKWWYEEAGGYFFAKAIRCRECRAKERARIDNARVRAGHAPKRS
ncbi:MAG: zinc-ribbon domain containing protein [Kofleriaceae bacterium]